VNNGRRTILGIKERWAALLPIFPVSSLPARLALATTLTLGAATWSGAAAAHSLAPSRVKPTQKLVALLGPHEAYARPTRTSRLLGPVQERRPLTGEQTMLPVLDQKKGTAGVTWLHVMLPGRPNSHTGWITQAETVASTTKWHLVVHTSARDVTVYQNGRPIRTVKAVVGKPSTPTPHGQFFVEEAVQLQADDVGAPFALALSARSDVFQEFDGGPGEIAMHGLDNVGGVPGTAISHGCIRLDDAVMRWLVIRIGPGVPVTITG
jgi:lipoprotein-anchoring transpeptidase ErfK/SrfK